MSWFLLWTLLVIVALAVPAWLSWRIFGAVKTVWRQVGAVSGAVSGAQADAVRTQQEWVQTRAAEDAQYAAMLAELARPLPRSLAEPRAYTETQQQGDGNREASPHG